MEESTLKSLHCQPNIQGREVAVLVNEEKPAGRYSVTWNATNVSSGVYFYRLVANGFVSTRKMLVTK